jgi:hypothetical protein
MGGPGSGWPKWKARRATTESSLALDIRALSRAHSRFAEESQFVHTWHHPGSPYAAASVSVRNSDRESAPRMTLAYSTHTGGAITAVVTLDKTTPFFGGIRWWFVCPSCGRRSALLFLPYGHGGFLCRRCHGLTYLSCRDSHRFDRLFVAITGDHGKEIGKALARRLKIISLTCRARDGAMA